MCLDGNDLIADQFQNAVDNRLETLKNLLIGKSHISIFNASLSKVGFDTDIHSPLLTIVAEVCLDTILKVHDTFGIHLPSCPRAIRQLHLPNLCPQDVTEVPVESR